MRVRKIHPVGWIILLLATLALTLALAGVVESGWVAGIAVATLVLTFVIYTVWMG
jgi:hypothetical protein